MPENKKREHIVKVQDKNVFITAGAGAGKSTLMVNRLVHQARTGKQPFKHIAAITFTNKAAAELEKSLLDKLTEEGDNPAYKQLLHELPELTLGTIHSFCQQMLTERPIEAGLSPGFTVLEDEAESKAMLSRILGEVLAAERSDCRESIEALEALDISPYDYTALLYSKAEYDELHIAETEQARIHKEEFAQKVDDLAATLTNSLTEIRNERFVWSEVGMFKAHFLKTQGDTTLSLSALLEDLVKTKETVSEILEQVFLKTEYNRITRNEALLKEFEIAFLTGPQQTIDRIVSYIKERFTERFQQMSFERDDWLTEFCRKPDLYYKDDTWMTSLQQLTTTAEARKQDFESIFNHFFETALNLTEPEWVFTKSGLRNYRKLQTATMTEKRELLSKNFALSKSNTRESFKEQFQDILDSCKQEVARLDWEKYETLFQLHGLFDHVIERYIEEKSMRNVLTNNDLLRKAYELLQNEEARAYFHEKYRYIYVDEFQDTDPLQTKILFYITSGKKPTSIANAAPVPGSLFVVGDPKQSIYRFRHADLRLYALVRKIAEENEADWLVETLQINFRSHPHLVEWFNEMFLPYFKQEPARDIQPKYDKMIGYEAKRTKEHFGIFKLEVEEDEIEEAEKIANWIATEYDKQANGLASAIDNYDDVLIITPKTGTITHYVKALKEKGIPTTFSGKIPAKNFPEIIRLVDLITYIAAPTRFMLEKIFMQNANISASFLRELREFTKTSSADEANLAAHFASNKEYEAYVKAKATFAYYVDLSRTMSPLNLLRTLVYDKQFGIFPAILTDIEHHASLSILTTFIEPLPSSQIVTLADLAAELMKGLEKTIEYEMLIDDDEPAVRIMNLHKTKGLEAKIVFLASPETLDQYPVTSIVERNGWEESVDHALFRKPFVQAYVDYQPDSMLAKLREEQRRTEAERIRLLYVAATRAERMLIITDKISDNQELTWDELLADQSITPLTVELFETEDTKRYIHRPLIAGKNEIEEQTIDMRTLFQNERSYTKNNPSEGPLVSGENIPEQLVAQSIDDTSKMTDNIAFKGLLWGSIIHSAYEYRILHPDDALDDGALRAIIGGGLEQYQLTDDELAKFTEAIHFPNRSEQRHDRLLTLMKDASLHEAIRTTVTPFFENPTYEQLISAYDAHPEVSFSAWIDAGAENIDLAEPYAGKAVYVNGIIDLVLAHRTSTDKIIIVDYKTDQLRPEETLDVFHNRMAITYKSQLQTYATVMRQLFHKQVETLYLYTVSSDTFVKVNL